MPSNNHKAPSKGQKVTLGENAPVTREGAGYVQDDSLAAESYSEGGKFASNRGAKPTAKSSEPGHNLQFHEPQNDAAFTSSQFASGEQRGHSKSQQIPSTEQGGAAPTYVNNQFNRDSNGPHGKNITEGFEDSSQYKDGMKAALNAEPGSINDPARFAEQNFQKKMAGTGRGPKDAKTGDEGGFAALKPDESI